MALQLIYTSAPRLLQAGRTGFGTVAAHPGIPSWLVGEIERASQFSRVPGLDSARVVLRHMIFGQGDRVHHVLSRIQDAGADYTGRTNHIAHHFVFTAAEAIKATELGVTPVDALAFLESHKLWQASWDAEPRPLGDDEILPVESIPRTITLPAETYWGALVPGRPECAAILAPGKTSEACWIVYPQGWGNAIVYAMGESLALHSNPWDVSFANDLQPTDNEQQIAWRGIPADSPILPKAQSSVRPCIDLTNPNDLQFQPLPEYAEEARTGKKPLPKSLSPAPSATKTISDSKKINAPPKNRPASATIPLLSKTNNQPRRNPYATPLMVILGILVLSLGVGGAIWGYQLIKKNAESTKEISGLKSEISAKIDWLDIQMKGSLSEKIDKAKKDLEKINNSDHLGTLSNFLIEISKENVSNSKKSLDLMQSAPYSSDWNNWRIVCHTLLRDKEKEIETKTLHDLYAKASQVDALSEEDWNQFQMLAKNLYAEDEKWQNALAAVNFLKEPSLDGVSHWIQKREMPESTNGLHLEDKVFKKINQIKVDEYNKNTAEISEENQFREGLVKLLKDWPQGSKQRKILEEFLAPQVETNPNQPKISNSEKFKILGLKPPKTPDSKSPDNIESTKVLGGENSKEGSLPPIFLILENSKKLEFAPTTSSSSSQKSDKWHFTNSLQINWNSFSSISVDTWDSNSASQFESSYKEHPAYYVSDQNSSPKTIKFFVIEKDKFDRIIPDFPAICKVDNSSITLNKDFITFLDRLYKDKEVKFITFLELKYEGNQFQENNLPKQKLEKTKPIALIDLNQTINKKKSELDIDLGDTSKQKIKLEKDLETKKSEIENFFPFKPTAMNPWEDFKNKIDKEINNHPEKEKLENFKQIFKRPKSHETAEGFLKEYNEVKNKEKFLTALSHFPEQQKKWFFFDGKEWSKESQEKFLKQFNKNEFDAINQNIENIDKEIKKLVETNISLQQKIANLEKLKTDQKATLNFYLDEADIEPFLTTEVTIPFRH